MQKFCSQCGAHGKTQLHHILPRHIGLNDNRTIRLCDRCHREFHRILQILEQQILQANRGMYIVALDDYLRKSHLRAL